jgi:hypothetical protein
MKVRLAIVFVLFALCCAWCSFADEEPVEHVEAVVTARHQGMIVLNVRVRNTLDRAVFVPTCGEIEGIGYLCTVALDVELYRNHRWRRARTCSDCSLVGGVVPKTGVTIPSQGSADFAYLLADDIYDVVKGQQSRLVMKSWNDAASMAAGEAPVARIASSGFAFPQRRSDQCMPVPPGSRR